MGDRSRLFVMPLFLSGTQKSSLSDTQRVFPFFSFSLFSFFFLDFFILCKASPSVSYAQLMIGICGEFLLKDFFEIYCY